MTDTVVDYRYRRPTSFVDGVHPSLALETSRISEDGATDEHPRLFSGFVLDAPAVAAGLLAVAKVASTRYYTPGAMVRAKIRAADPVVTADGERLRFESLSRCSGVYARLDILADGLDSEFHGIGTTNVDLNEPARRALAGIVASEPLRLDIGEEEVRMRTLDADIVERQVPLPDRWIRSFAEVHVSCRELQRRFGLSAAAARQLFARFPKASARASLWLVGSGEGAVQSLRPVKGAVPVAGPERLAALLPVLRFGRRVWAYGPPGEMGHSAWVVELGGARLTLVLSPEVNRGFSGEGGMLTSLADPTVSDDAARLCEHLVDGANCNTGELAAVTGMPHERVLRALTVLGSTGNVGFDVSEQCSFLRKLPFRSGSSETTQPRLATAERLVASGAVSGGPRRFEVRSQEVVHAVDLDGDARCTCLWWARHHGERGPCSHVLAAQMTAEAWT